MRSRLLLAVLVLGLGTAPARGHGGMLRRPTEVRYSYYPPAPVVWVPVAQPLALPVVIPPLMQVPAVVNVPLAAPTPAPPSAGPEPSAGPGTSALKPIAPYYDLYSGATRPGVPLAAGRCSVAFWNLTGRPITLRVAEQDRTLPPGRSVTLELPHEFAWRVVGREAEAARIPATHTTAEILIRR